jgi:branched-chain amino acid transport system ATP-binding protein
VQAVLAVVRQLADEGVGVLLVEQDAGLALRTAGRAVVLETGRVVAAGTPEQVRPSLGAAYLGDT